MFKSLCSGCCVSVAVFRLLCLGCCVQVTVFRLLCLGRLRLAFWFLKSPRAPWICFLSDGIHDCMKTVPWQTYSKSSQVRPVQCSTPVCLCTQISPKESTAHSNKTTHQSTNKTDIEAQIWTRWEDGRRIEMTLLQQDSILPFAHNVLFLSHFSKLGRRQSRNNWWLLKSSRISKQAQEKTGCNLPCKNYISFHINYQWRHGLWVVWL